MARFPPSKINWPVLDEYDSGALSKMLEIDPASNLETHTCELCKFSEPPPTAVPLHTDINGMAISVFHPSGVLWDEKDWSIVGPNISAALGLRVLRRYLHPDSVKQREQSRKENRQQAWQRIRPVDQARLIGWRRCYYCWENNWCIVNNTDETPLMEPICEECFSDDLF